MYIYTHNIQSYNVHIRLYLHLWIDFTTLQVGPHVPGFEIMLIHTKVGVFGFSSQNGSIFFSENDENPTE